jgi:1-acyl-sn-glycerol-3-phosphate acyltransferase
VDALGRGLARLVFPCVRLLMEIVVRIVFRRLATSGIERLPARGPVLVVANHPAAWTDAVVLDVALRRKLRFVAHERLFHPRIRGVLLELHASLPVRYRHEDPASEAANRATFDRCHALFRRGAAIVMFPEGVSGGDRVLRPLRPGAARLALEQVAGDVRAPALVPVAIHYEDRTMFRTRVDVAVGEPLAVPEGDLRAPDPERAARALTDTIARALEAALATAAAQARAEGTPGGAGAPPLRRGRVAAGVVGGLAMAGIALHLPPARATDWVARKVTGLPQQIAFGRIFTGLVLFPLWYLALAGLAAALGGGAWFALPLAAPWLGLLACREMDRRREPIVVTRAAAREGVP